MKSIRKYFFILLFLSKKYLIVDFLDYLFIFSRLYANLFRLFRFFFKQKTNYFKHVNSRLISQSFAAFSKFASVDGFFTLQSL